MEEHPRPLNRLRIQYRTGRDGGEARTVVCTITAPARVSRAELDLADALISLIERRTAEPLLEG
jgi:hypothetical protein